VFEGLLPERCGIRVLAAVRYILNQFDARAGNSSNATWPSSPQKNTARDVPMMLVEILRRL
jgi:hypothetical protein